VIALTSHIWAVWSSVIAIEQRRFFSEDAFGSLRRLSRRSMANAIDCFADVTSGLFPGLNVRPTAFCQNVSVAAHSSPGVVVSGMGERVRNK